MPNNMHRERIESMIAQECVFLDFTHGKMEKTNDKCLISMKKDQIYSFFQSLNETQKFEALKYKIRHIIAFNCDANCDSICAVAAKNLVEFCYFFLFFFYFFRFIFF